MRHYHRLNTNSVDVCLKIASTQAAPSNWPLVATAAPSAQLCVIGVYTKLLSLNETALHYKPPGSGFKSGSQLCLGVVAISRLKRPAAAVMWRMWALSRLLGQHISQSTIYWQHVTVYNRPFFCQSARGPRDRSVRIIKFNGKTFYLISVKKWKINVT